MINNSSFGFSPFKLNPKLEFYYLSIYSLRPTLLLFFLLQTVALALLRVVCLAVGFFVCLVWWWERQRRAAWEQGQNPRGRWRAPCFVQSRDTAEAKRLPPPHIYPLPM